MLRQIEWRLQNGPITRSGVLPVTTLFLEPPDVPTIQTSMFVFFVSA